ncbi:ATP-grasp domain-containing protein [Kitasatospora sp. NPDC050463]|uniref:ATP-grasp domain-containing protein n=1 Tax=Kitasatospora sp. NPDC050463 TaxID=3155786 RepID=UPI00340A23B1
MPAEPTPQKLLLVGGVRAVPLGLDMAKLALDQAHARGLRTHLTNQEAVLAATPGVTEQAGAVSAVDFARPGEAAAWARDRAGEGERFDAVLALQEMAQVAAAETAEALDLPGNPPEAVRRVRTKDACRAALAAAGFRQPTVELCADEAQAAAFLTGSTGPWIVKPRDAMGSTGVSRITGPDGLPAAIALLPGQGPFLVEEFVQGAEYSVEGLFLGGEPVVIAVTEKEKVEPPFFVEVGHILPAELPDAQREEIERQVRAALAVLGLRSGAFHVELWLSPDGIVLGEVHGRFGGDWIHRMLAHVVPGLELFGLIYDDLLGLPRAAAPAPTRAAAARYLTPPSGLVTAVEGWTEAAGHPDVLYADLAVAPGGTVRPLRTSGDRVGVIVVGADTPDQARKLARELADSVRFTVEPARTAAPA